MSPSLPLPLSGLIPHRPPMLAVDTLIELTDDEAVSETVFSPDSIFMGDGHVEEAVLFEMIAQTFAGAMAAGGRKAGATAGYLVGLKRVSLHAPALAGLPVRVRAKIISRVEDFFVVQGEVHQQGQLLAAGQITVFVPEDGGAL